MRPSSPQSAGKRDASLAALQAKAAIGASGDDDGRPELEAYFEFFFYSERDGPGLLLGYKLIEFARRAFRVQVYASVWFWWEVGFVASSKRPA